MVGPVGVAGSASRSWQGSEDAEDGLQRQHTERARELADPLHLWRDQQVAPVFGQVVLVL